MTKNVHVCTIRLRPEVVYDVISGRNVKTIEGYIVVNFEVATANIFQDTIQKNHFVNAEAEEADIDDSIKRKRFRLEMIF